MNTTFKRTNSLKNDLVILSDGKNLDWTDNYLTSGEISVFVEGIKNKVKTFVFPKAINFAFIQILPEDGQSEAENKENARIAAADMLEKIQQYKIKSVTLISHADTNRMNEYAEGLVLANYQFLKYFSDKNKEAKKSCLEKVSIHASCISKKDFNSLDAVLEATCKARDLVNEPHSFMNAPQFSKEVEAAGKKYGFSTKVLQKKEIEKLKMGGLLAVNLGSYVPPTFNIMEWKPKNAKNSKPIVLVGKGVMFDTGGVSLKPTKNSMDFMKCDMAGAAGVLGMMIAAAKNKLPVHLVALVAATDNRPGKDAYLPGDVITTYSGITVEILNTDAEGRMTLADALHYAKQYDPELVLDFATLTGSAAVALGPEGVAYMGNADSKVKYQMEDSGFNTYERVVEFPIWREYGETIKSDIADIKNLGAPYAGMITAGMFLQHFTDYPWLHFDIAGMAYLHKKSAYRTKEGTGVAVRLIFDFLNQYFKIK